MFIWLANWWDGVDLWLSQLAFPFQFAIVIAVLAPVCFGLAWAIDRVVDLASGRLNRARSGPDATITTPEPPPVRADVPPGTPGMIIATAPDQRGQQVEATAAAGRGSEPAGS